MANQRKPEADRARYLSALRRMTPEQRLAKTAELSEMTHVLLRAGIRRRFPEASESEVQRIYLERIERCRKRTY